MASGAYNRAIKRILDRSLDLTTGVKVMLVKSTYTYDPDHDFVTNGAGDATDPAAKEIVATNYAGGFSGAGRKTATLTFVEDDTNNRAVIKIVNITWTALGGAVNDTVAAAIVYKSNTSDSDSDLVAYLDIPDTPTNGSDFTLSFDATSGNIRFTT